MKNYDSNYNPFAGAGILGTVTPVAIYLIGCLAFLVWGGVTLLLLPWFMLGSLDEVAFMNVTAIVSLVLQVVFVIIATLVLSVFSDLKIYHLLISAAVSGMLFFIVERFIPKIRWINFPWQMMIFERLFTNVTYSRNDVFIGKRLYLITTLILTGAFFAVSLITWGIYQIASRNKKPKEDL